MTKDDRRDGKSGGLTLSGLTNMLHVPLPGMNAFVFKGAKGTFIVNKDFTPPAKRLLEESREEED